MLFNNYTSKLLVINLKSSMFKFRNKNALESLVPLTRLLMFGHGNAWLFTSKCMYNMSNNIFSSLPRILFFVLLCSILKGAARDIY